MTTFRPTSGETVGRITASRRRDRHLEGMSETPTAIPNPLLDVDEVAAWLAVSPSTVRWLTRRGEMPAVRVGAQYRYRQETVAAWVAASESEAVLARQRVAMSKGSSGDPRGGKQTLSQWWDTWTATRQVRPTTAVRDEMIWRRQISPAPGQVRLADLRRSTVAAWAAGLIDSCLAPATVVCCVAVLRACLSAAVRDELLSTNPAAGVSVASDDTSEQRFLSAVELATLEEAMDPQWSLVVRSGRPSGCESRSSPPYRCGTSTSQPAK